MRFFIEFSKKLFVVLLAVGFSITAMRAQLNQVDNQGRRQGAWILDGSMVKDPGYAAHAKVEEGAFLNGEKTGLWKRYWPDGNLRSEINFMKGRPEGPYKIYYAGGQLEEVGEWQEGKYTNKFQRFYANGRPKEELTYDQEGNRQGVQKYYHENGALALEVGMKDGAENGIQKRYDSDGQLMEERQFDNGKVKAGGAKSYMTNSQSKSAQMAGYAPGGEHHTNSAQEFNPDGYNVLYNANGQVSMVGDFMNGKLYNGRIHHYDNNGLQTGSEIFTRGKSTGQVNKKQNDQ
jgi:antitoxin component YwqK of YwqJK toxin-antitoxin module